MTTLDNEGSADLLGKWVLVITWHTMPEDAHVFSSRAEAESMASHFADVFTAATYRIVEV